MYLMTQPNTVARAAVASICYRLGLPGVSDANFKNDKKFELPNNPTLRDVAQLCVREATSMEQANWGNRVTDVVTRAMTTSDFSAILADVSNKQMASSYEERPASFTRWASSGDLPNFKPEKICRVSAPGVLPEIKEDGAYKYITLEDGFETVRIKTYGGILSISRQSIINDDMGALIDRSRLLAQSAALTQSKIAVGVLSGVTALSDGKALFHADRGNLMTGGTSALSSDSLSAAVAIMRRFCDVNGQPLMIEPKYLIVGPGNERLAYQLAYSDSDPGTNNSGTVNFLKKAVGLEVLVDPLLESGSLTAWYLLPDPLVVPVVRYFTLGGEKLAPYIESNQGFNNDNLEMKTRVDFAAAAIGHFAVKSAGV